MSVSDSERDPSPHKLRRRRRPASDPSKQNFSFLNDSNLNYAEKKRGLRRTLSVTLAEEVQTEAKRIRNAQPDHPIHFPKDSLFSWSSGFTDFSGLVNWGALLLALGSVRLLLENFIKYGVRIDPWQWLFVLSGGDSSDSSSYPSISLLLFLHLHILISLVVELILSKEWVSEKVGLFAQVLNLVVLVSLPIVFLNLNPKAFSLIGAISVTASYTVLFLKLWSYVQVNHWCREYFRSAEGKRQRRHSLMQREMLKHSNPDAQITRSEISYPENLGIRDLFYFVYAPTLCYELNFPRSTRIRKRFLVKRIAEVLILGNLILALFQQWMVPTIKTSIKPFSQMSVMRITERLLKLALPNHLVWLMAFYLLFHAFLNTIGELLMFADRHFYKDWWNAGDVEEFWRFWNLPVHRWASRHLYQPMIKKGYKRLWAMVTVFFFSAFFHEYLVSVPLRMFRIWAFMGMMAQVPLAMLSKFASQKFDKRWGNVLVWSSLILGQPLAMLMYYHDYVVYHHSDTLNQYNQTHYL